MAPEVVDFEADYAVGELEEAFHRLSTAGERKVFLLRVEEWIADQQHTARSE